MIDALPLGEIRGQHAPLDPTFGDIKNGIEHGPHAQGARASPAFGGGDQLLDPRPFFVGQVAWICLFIHILYFPLNLSGWTTWKVGVKPTSTTFVRLSTLRGAL